MFSYAARVAPVAMVVIAHIFRPSRCTWRITRCGSHPCSSACCQLPDGHAASTRCTVFVFWLLFLVHAVQCCVALMPCLHCAAVFLHCCGMMCCVVCHAEGLHGALVQCGVKGCATLRALLRVVLSCGFPLRHCATTHQVAKAW